MTTVFISHSSMDSGFAGRLLKRTLEDNGMTVWCSSTDMPVAVDWEKQILQALRRSDWFVVVLSPDAAASDWVRAEAHWALENRKGRVVPAMIRSCDPAAVHLKLGTIQFVDFRSDPEHAAAALLSVIEGHCQQPGASNDTATMMLPVVKHKMCSVSVVLVLTFESGQQQEVAIDIDGQCVIGRARDATFHLDHYSVSRRHARLSALSDGEKCGLVISDLASSNGTFVNHSRILSDQRLSEGDLLDIGGVRILIKRVSNPVHGHG